MSVLNLPKGCHPLRTLSYHTEKAYVDVYPLALSTLLDYNLRKAKRLAMQP